VKSTDSIINNYRAQIERKTELNKMFIKKQYILEVKIDSLEVQKNKIITIYDQKIKSINDASAYDDAVWLRNTITSNNNTK